MGVFDDLLVVQDHDTLADQLRHRRANLAESAELARSETELAGVERALGTVAAERDAMARRQRRHEDELAAAEGRVAEVERRLYSGAVNVPRELQAMQSEVVSLRRLASSIEDEVLAAMTEREPLDAEVARLEAEQGRLDAEGARLRVAIAEAQTAIDAQLATETESRAKSAAVLPPDLASLYERLRASLGGVGAARLVNGRCSGCHLTLPATELDRIRHEPPDTLVRCDQCGRVLVH